MKSLKALGHEPILRTTPDPTAAGAQAAIINLGSEKLAPQSLISALNQAGVCTIGHAGHKETEKLEFGREIGCKILATNSQITYHIDKLLLQAGNIP